MGMIEEAREAINEGRDFGWTMPLVVALGREGRRWSLRWVEQCLRRLLPFAESDDNASVLDAINELNRYEGLTPSQDEIWDRSYEISRPCYAARVAVCHLYRAWWYSRFQEDDQFVVAQEAALRLMLEGTGRANELRDALFEEYDRVAATAAAAEPLASSGG